MTIRKQIWIGFVISIWVWVLYQYGLDYTIEIYSKINLRIVLECLGIFIIVPVVYYFSNKIPFFSWHLGKLFKTESKNLGIIPLSVKGWGILFSIVFLAALPHLARFEEELFRKGTSSIPEAIVRSILFGFVHMLMGVNGSAAAALSVVGLWLSYRYMIFGLDSAILGHTIYNSIWVVIMVIAFTFGDPPKDVD